MDTSSTPRKGKKGLGRLWTKIKLAIRPKSKTKKKPASAPTVAAAPTLQVPETAPQIQPTQPVQSIQPTQPEPVHQPAVAPEPPATTMATPTHATPATPAHQVDDSTRLESDTQPTKPEVRRSTQEATTSPREKAELARRYERAQAIFKKYDLEFDEAGWDMHPKQQVERVMKAPRMRVRWTCHECKTTFGHDKICVECAHHRCRSCARYPPKKKKARAAKQAAIAAAMAEPPHGEAREATCHECQTAFDIGSQECSNCHHRICERCLQETLSAPEGGQTSAAVAV